MDYQFPADIIVENPDAVKQKKHEFQHAASGGKHFEAEFICECGAPAKVGVCPKCAEATKPKLVPSLDSANQPKFKNGKPVMKVQTIDVGYGRGCKYGDIFRSNMELDTLHNRQGQPPKFVRLDAGHNPDSFALHEERQRNEKLLAEKRKLLERMSREQLQEYAEHELGLTFEGKATKKEKLLEAIIKQESELVPA